MPPASEIISIQSVPGKVRSSFGFFPPNSFGSSHTASPAYRPNERRTVGEGKFINFSSSFSPLRRLRSTVARPGETKGKGLRSAGAHFLFFLSPAPFSCIQSAQNSGKKGWGKIKESGEGIAIFSRHRGARFQSRRRRRAVFWLRKENSAPLQP